MIKEKNNLPSKGQIMQNENKTSALAGILRFLSRSSADAVAIVSLFYFFAAVTGYKGASMPASRFFLILLFGVLSEGAHLLLDPGIAGVPGWISRLLHFSVLLAAFLILTLSAGLFSGGAKIFAAVVLFAAVYALIAFVYHLLRKAQTKEGK